MRLEVETEVFPEGSLMVAHAKSLDVSSCGKTEDEAFLALMEAVRLFVATSLEMGTLEQILAESGYVLQGEEWLVPGRAEAPSSAAMLPVTDAARRFASMEI